MCKAILEQLCRVGSPKWTNAGTDKSWAVARRVQVWSRAYGTTQNSRILLWRNPTFYQMDSEHTPSYWNRTNSQKHVQLFFHYLTNNHRIKGLNSDPREIERYRWPYYRASPVGLQNGVRSDWHQSAMGTILMTKQWKLGYPITNWKTSWYA